MRNKQNLKRHAINLIIKGYKHFDMHCSKELKELHLQLKGELGNLHKCDEFELATLLRRIRKGVSSNWQGYKQWHRTNDLLGSLLHIARTNSEYWNKQYGQLNKLQFIARNNLNNSNQDINIMSSDIVTAVIESKYYKIDEETKQTLLIVKVNYNGNSYEIKDGAYYYTDFEAGDSIRCRLVKYINHYNAIYEVMQSNPKRIK